MDIQKYGDKINKQVEKWIKKTIRKNDNYDMGKVSLILTLLIKKYQQYNFIPIKQTPDGLLVLLADKQMALLINDKFDVLDYCKLIDEYKSSAKEKYFELKSEEIKELS